jgi:hypothetical protein
MGRVNLAVSPKMQLPFANAHVANAGPSCVLVANARPRGISILLRLIQLRISFIYSMHTAWVFGWHVKII